MHVQRPRGERERAAVSFDPPIAEGIMLGDSRVEVGEGRGT